MTFRTALDRWILPVIVAIGGSWPHAAHGQATIEYTGVTGAGVRNAQEARKVLPGAPLPELDFGGPAEPSTHGGNAREPAQADAPSYGPDADQGYPPDVEPTVTIYSE